VDVSRGQAGAEVGRESSDLCADVFVVIHVNKFVCKGVKKKKKKN
jgi:hypothetical protein